MSCAVLCCNYTVQVGASNLGHIILYSILNQTEGLLCDRAYFPGEEPGSRAGCGCSRCVGRWLGRLRFAVAA